MSTKISLGYPYSSDWKRGYVVTNRENRKTLILYNSSSDRTSTQYARYLTAVKLGRYLTSGEEVDHIDEDKTNDHIDNLRVVSPSEHRAKNIVYLDGVCYICGSKIRKKKSDVRPKIKQKKLIDGELCCSRTCGYKKTSLTLKKKA